MQKLQIKNATERIGTRTMEGDQEKVESIANCSETAFTQKQLLDEGIETNTKSRNRRLTTDFDQEDALKVKVSYL